MPVTFSLKSDKGFYGSYSATPLEIKGIFMMQGPQSGSMIPPGVLALFEQYPELKSVALNRDNGGAVWTRIEDDPEETTLTPTT